MMTVLEVLNIPQPLTGDHVRKVNASLREIGDRPELSQAEMAVIAATNGLLNGLAKMLDTRQAKRAEAKPYDGLTSLDV